MKFFGFIPLRYRGRVFLIFMFYTFYVYFKIYLNKFFFCKISILAFNYNFYKYVLFFSPSYFSGGLALTYRLLKIVYYIYMYRDVFVDFFFSIVRFFDRFLFIFLSLTGALIYAYFNIKFLLL